MKLLFHQRTFRLVGHRTDLRAQCGLFAAEELRTLEAVIDGLTRHPLTERARDILNRRLREGLQDVALSELAIGLADDGRLFTDPNSTPSPGVDQPHLICSIGLLPASSSRE